MFGNWLHSVSYCVQFSWFIFCLLSQHLPAPKVIFFLLSHLLGFPSHICLIVSIHSFCPVQHFDLGVISLFGLFLAFLIIPVVPLPPFFISIHLISNCCHHFLNILHLVSLVSSFRLFCCSLFSVILFLMFSLYSLIISISFNILTSYFIYLAPCVFLYSDIFC